MGNKSSNMKELTVKRGKLIQAPTGSGKTTWRDNLVSSHYHNYLDGDRLLLSAGVKNRHYFWYNQGCEKEREAIQEIFEQSLNQGKNILYSGHPDLLPTDVLVIIPKEKRWKNLKKRDGYIPTKERFEEEEMVYQEASKRFPTYSSFDDLLK